MPFVFTEHGAIMLASVLNSPVAINASIHVVRAFVKLRDILIPQESFNFFVKENKPYFSRNVVISFANELGIHPSIVVGRLQYEELIPYTHLRNLISKVRPVLGEYVKA
jgi:hypothetical protein